MNSRLPLGLVLLLLVAQLTCSAIWLGEDQFPSGYEVPDHLVFTRKMANELSLAWAQPRRTQALVDWVAANRRVGGRSTLVHLTMAAPMAAIGGDSVPLVSFAIGALSLICLTLASYLLVERLAGPGPAGLATAMILLLGPVWGLSRKCNVDLPLTAAVCLFAALLLRARPWSTALRATALGLLAGLICLIKAPFVLWAPCLVLPALICAWREGLALRELLPRLAVFCLAAAVGSLLFWWGAWAELADYAQYHVTSLDNPSTRLNERWTWNWALFYARATGRWLGWPLGLLTGLGLLGGLRETNREQLLVWSWILLSYLLFTAVSVKWARYYLPAMLFVCALGAVGLRRLPWRLCASSSGAALLLAGWIYLSGSFGTPPAWSLLDRSICHAPRQANWREAAMAMRRELGRARPAAIGIEGPPGWATDDYSRLEYYLLEFFPLTEIQRASTERGTEELAAYQAALGRFEMRLQIRLQGEPVVHEIPENWLEIGSWTITSTSAHRPPLVVSLIIARALLDASRQH